MSDEPTIPYRYTREGCIDQLWGALCIALGGVLGIWGLGHIAPEPYRSVLLDWSLFGFMAAGYASMLNLGYPRWRYIWLFGPHVLCSFAFYQGLTRWRHRKATP